MKKLFCLLLALMMIVLAVASCDTNDNNEPIDDTKDAVVGEDVTTEADSNSESEAQTDMQTDALVTPIEIDLSQVKIVCDAQHNLTIANSLKSKMSSAAGVVIPIVKKSADKVYDYEIIIGEADREISKECFDLSNSKYFGAKGFVFKDGKIQLLGIDKNTITASVEYFLENFVVSGSKVINLSEGDVYMEEITHESLSIPKRISDTSIRLVSNNIAMQSLNSSTARLPGLIAAYKYYDADIYTLQEVDKGWRTDDMLFGNMERMGYTLVTDGDKMYSCPIFYKTERFNLVDAEYVLYDLSGLSLQEARAYAWACLEEKTTGKRLIVVSTHFIAKADADKEAHRQRCAEELVEISVSLTKKYNADGVVMAGDFNCNMSSNPYKTMAAALNSAREVCPSRVNMGYKTSCSFGTAPAKAEGQAIDHVFYSKSGVDAKHFETIVSTYSYAYSDHVPVVFDFELN